MDNGYASWTGFGSSRHDGVQALTEKQGGGYLPTRNGLTVNKGTKSNEAELHRWCLG